MISARCFQWSVWDGTYELPDVSPLLRRRMSRLTRMAVAVGLDCCKGAGVAASKPRVVFASRHGELGITLPLLAQLAEREPLSPMDFSGSVHHAAAGYFSLVAKNRQAIRAIAGGEASFGYGFLDAAGMLADSDATPVLLMVADDEVPNPLNKISGKHQRPYAAAFLWSRSQPGKSGTVSLSMSYEPSARTSAEIPALQFLRWFQKGKKPLTQQLSQRVWRWQK